LPGIKAATRTVEPTAAAPRAQSLTEQQHAAIHNRDVSIALSAGAGCGKTYVLTRRFLSHLTPGRNAPELSRLVAITFTERAAREMRDRIRNECRRTLRECPADEVDYWLAIVRQLDTARISTIHSFCASLLRSHAVEARLDPRFKLLDETTSLALLRNSVAEGLHALLAADDADSRELVFEFGIDRARTLLEGLVLDRYRMDFDRWREKPAGELAREWEEAWRTQAAPALLRELVASEPARRTLAILRENEPDHPVMKSRRRTILDELPELEQAFDPPAALDLLRGAARIQGGGGKEAWGDEELYEEVKEALTGLRALIDRTREQWDFSPEHVLPAAEFGLRVLRVTEQVGSAYDRDKRSGAWLDFEDLLLGARNLLNDHPEARRRVAAGISLLLVDEFQDTDPIQTEIVRYLCGEMLLRGKLFVVGDVKQSIYRFRRAEPRVFRELRQEIPAAGRLPLSKNFRSQPAILNFVNVLFDGALGLEYEDLVPSCEQLSETPCIEFLFSRPEAAGEEPDDFDDSAAGRRKLEAEWIARRLKQLLHDGKPRVRVRGVDGDALRPLQLKDVVILFRAMTDVRYYEAALRDQGLDYYVVGGQAFFAQQEVFDLVNLCRTLDDPDDEVALIGVLRSPFFSWSDDALLALARRKSEAQRERRRRLSLTAALDDAPPPWLSEPQRERYSFAARVLKELRAVKDRLPLARLLALAVEKTGYDAALLTEFLGKRKLANLRKLIDLARQFDRTGLFTLADFVERLQESVGEEIKEPLAATHPESSDVIRLMSIHQSKGLEFPLVVVADMDRRGNDLPPSGCFDPTFGPLVALPEKFGEKRENLGLRLMRLRDREENLAETLRLLYVATTRAADHLILSAGLKDPSRVTHPWLKLLSTRFDLSTGQPRTAPTADGVSILAKYSERIPGIHIHHRIPEAPLAPGKGRHESLPLSKLRETLDAAETVSLPPLAKPIPLDGGARRRFSVSAIRQADLELKGRAAESLDSADDLSDDLAARATEEHSDDRAPGAGGDEARLLGDVVHLVLERIDPSNPGDPASLVKDACEKAAPALGDRGRGIAVACIESFLASSVRAEIAGALRCEREIEFHLPWPLPSTDPHRTASPKIIVGKLDCLLRTRAGEWVVLDYKTGRLPPGKAAVHVLAEYEMQLAIYSLAVRGLSGRWPARSELVLLREGALPVAFDPGLADWDLLFSRIDAALGAMRGPIGSPEARKTSGPLP